MEKCPKCKKGHLQEYGSSEVKCDKCHTKFKKARIKENSSLHSYISSKDDNNSFSMPSIDFGSSSDSFGGGSFGGGGSDGDW